MIEVERNPLFRDCKQCSACRRKKDDVEFFNIVNNIIRLCGDCRKELISVIQSVEEDKNETN